MNFTEVVVHLSKKVDDFEEVGRRGNGEGSFKKRTWTNKDGKQRTVWRFSVSLGGKVWNGTGDTKKEAESNAKAKFAEHVADLQKSSVPVIEPPKAIPTFREWLETFNAHKARQGRADKTLQRYGELARTWSALNPDGMGPMGERLLTDVSIMELELCIEALHRMSEHNSVRTAKGYLSAALQRAFLMRIVERNEAALLDPIGFKRKRKLNLNSAGFNALVQSAQGDAPMLAALVLGRYGLRIAETCGVTSGDLVGNVLTLSRQLGRVTTDGKHGPSAAHRKDGPRPTDARTPKGNSTLALCKLKTTNAERRIHLSDQEARIIMAALDSAKADTLWDSVAGEWRTVMFVCHGARGYAQDDNKLRDRYNATRARADVDCDYHDLRALFATTAADAGIPMSAISRALGHSSVQVTELYVRDLQDPQTEVWNITATAVSAALAL